MSEPIAQIRAKLNDEYYNDFCCGSEDARCDVHGFEEMRSALLAVLKTHAPWEVGHPDEPDYGRPARSARPTIQIPCVPTGSRRHRGARKAAQPMNDPLPLLAADGARIGWVATSSVPVCAVDYCAKCAACLECETEDGAFLPCWGADEPHLWAVRTADLDTFRKEHDNVEVAYD